mmetsp:Transcript_88071/g.131997  ORF Transcript_88071/g.131997 Transcript_88071/m.131997 type:complete len:144 (+) Transcript_88071:79-510(+)|eukprot:CAMPEP_0117047674 /NCGR_PEP_ID=MMETSP0472-20121206/32940_1 /TAXON_ID=693140 ORGANISM="Tiarina fusus, Strain LIS" /NCGR_SAMPLE_ID=MMETSP0472 /ASSEMBLY_ACC=CAM_ASM_000603 /LENGTH=143 /DNA_ID=CAMNT_0004760451 /DNA_START=74 /DNA_END=505 /DNA_ORIENTATION=+
MKVTYTLSEPRLDNSSQNTENARHGGVQGRPQEEPNCPSSQDTMEQRDTPAQKEMFLLFVRVLMKYIEKKDPNMHGRARAIILNCAERGKRGEPGYESVTASMKKPLLDLVGKRTWNRAKAYLKRFLEGKEDFSGVEALVFTF